MPLINQRGEKVTPYFKIVAVLEKLKNEIGRKKYKKIINIIRSFLDTIPAGKPYLPAEEYSSDWTKEIRKIIPNIRGMDPDTEIAVSEGLSYIAVIGHHADWFGVSHSQIDPPYVRYSYYREDREQAIRAANPPGLLKRLWRYIFSHDDDIHIGLDLK